ncbi:MAG: DNA gyrase inhibitor YacG [Planctomycetaceae bacterium]|nr:DNA gyrase inhibitor YacG [Planctomycetaceae bacterium]
MSKTTTCPICRKTLASDAARESEYFPFCSERCRHVDFFRWSEGKYAIVEPLTELPEGFDQPAGGDVLNPNSEDD